MKVLSVVDSSLISLVILRDESSPVRNQSLQTIGGIDDIVLHAPYVGWFLEHHAYSIFENTRFMTFGSIESCLFTAKLWHSCVQYVTLLHTYREFS